MSEDLMNPDLKKEFLGGFMRTGISVIATALCIFGIVFILKGTTDSPMILMVFGEIIYVLGILLFVYLIHSAAKMQHGGFFRYGNIIFKSILLLIFSVLFILINYTYIMYLIGR